MRTPFNCFGVEIKCSLAFFHRHAADQLALRIEDVRHHINGLIRLVSRTPS